MLSLCSDIIVLLCKYSTNREKINLSMACTRLDKLKCVFMYCEKIHIGKILKLSFFDNFESVQISNETYEYPKNVKEVHLRTETTNIPEGVTHLKFGYDFNEPIENIIPQSVIHLIFGACFDQPIKDNLPQCLKYLELGWIFNQPIENSISSSFKIWPLF